MKGQIFKSSWKTGKIFGCIWDGFKSADKDEEEKHWIESMSYRK